MSSDRTNNRNGPLKPALASTRTPRAPLAPRVAGGRSTSPRVNSLSPTTSIQSAPGRVAARLRPQDASVQANDQTSQISESSAVRPYVRGLKGESSISLPAQLNKTQTSRPTPPRLHQASADARASPTTGLGINSGSQARIYARRPSSVVNNGTAGQSSALIGKQGINGEEKSPFFHASDAKKQEAPIKKPEPKKASAFFYADGKEERSMPNEDASSSVSRDVFAVPDNRGIPQIEPDCEVEHKGPPPMTSPGISSLSNSSPYFAMHLTAGGPPRSPSPSKENIHLSYRKGASQIFGTRPSPRIAPLGADEHFTNQHDAQRVQAGYTRPHPAHPTHRKSPSLSSIDSGPTSGGRRLSVTSAIGASPSPTSSPHRPESSTAVGFSKTTIMRDIPTIDTSLESNDAPAEPLSPGKGSVDLATEARRERKVLDLEISNSSLLAINASLEREIRRQKAELKRFRRLSRAGRLSTHLSDHPILERMSTLDEEAFDAMDGEHMTGLADPYEDLSEAESESVVSGDAFSHNSNDGQEQDRLARDEKRLRIDLQRHRELLVQSQMMNQSIQRCMYATEEMITDGRKALAYQVNVSDIKLGGRILTGHEDEDCEGPGPGDEDSEHYVMTLEASKPSIHRARQGSLLQSETGDIDSAQQLLQVWQGVGRPSLESSEGGDRDSGIEVEKAIPILSAS